MCADEIIEAMMALRNDSQREILMRFFKTGPGQYGEGDQFLGIKVPETRLIAKTAVDLPLDEVPTLLTSQWHEVRLCGFLILTYQMQNLCKKMLLNNTRAIDERDKLVSLYLDYADKANNWDLVDLSAPKILGQWMIVPSHIKSRLSIMDALAQSDSLWRQRIAMVSTWKTTQAGDPTYAMRFAEMLLFHTHDLIHKAVGWMLREVAHRCDKALVEDFLDRYASTMPRTALRYTIEKFPAEERQYWMRRKNRNQ